jgi:hypothetical protein
MRFAIDPRTTEDVQLSFNVLQSDGILAIHLNGELLQNTPIQKGSPAPITLPAYLLKQDNVLHFSVNSPGFAFWTMNRYELSSIQITGDITNDANSAHTQNVYVSETEKEYAETVELQFFPDCDLVDVGPLRITMNGQILFNGIPDCGLYNFVNIDPEVLVVGSNTLGFSSSMGSYVIDQMELEVELDNPGNPVFYFDLNEDLFVREQIGDRYCGKIDGYCPNNCEIYDDKDCCFDQSSNNYWCDARPENVRDRCVNQVLAGYANDCPSGYEDRNSEPHEDFEGICGDDEDGYCPVGCNSDYDKDCCYAQAGRQFWCDDIPFTGVDNTCTSAVSVSECNACPDGYRDEDDKRPNCPVQDTVDFASEDELKSGVDIVLESYFTNQDYKRLDFIINGYAIPVDTYNTRIYRNINEYVHEGTNSLELKPRDDVTISQVRIVVE